MLTYLSSQLDAAFALRASTDYVFLGCAVVGITLFLLRGLLMLAGGLFADVDEHHDYDHDHATEPSFKFLTLHSLTGFLMVFGLLGLGLRHQLDFPFEKSLGVAFLAGFLMMLIVAAIFYGAAHLTSSGEVFSAHDLIGHPAVVYLRIAPAQDGKIQVQVRGVIRELGARAHGVEAIESFVHVKVVGVIDENTVLVTPLKT